MRGRVLAGIGLVLAFAASGACTSYRGDTSSSAGDDAGGAEASLPDAPALPGPDGGGPSDAADAADAADAGPPNLLTNGDFELGCAGWIGSSSTSVVEDTTSHSGAKSCRVCIANGGGAYLNQMVSVTLPAGAQLVMAAWVRSAPGAGTPTPSTELDLLSGGTIVQSTSESVAPVPSTTWEHVSSLITTTTTGDTVAPILMLAGTTGQCVLLDDATLYRLK